LFKETSIRTVEMAFATMPTYTTTKWFSCNYAETVYTKNQTLFPT